MKAAYSSSDTFPAEHGICQGPVLLPMFFLPVTDDLLCQLAIASAKQGILVKDVYVRYTGHIYYICSTAANVDHLNFQANTISHITLKAICSQTLWSMSCQSN